MPCPSSDLIPQFLKSLALLPIWGRGYCLWSLICIGSLGCALGCFGADKSKFPCNQHSQSEEELL